MVLLEIDGLARLAGPARWTADQGKQGLRWWRRRRLGAASVPRTRILVLVLAVLLVGRRVSQTMEQQRDGVVSLAYQSDRNANG